jgi:hypothetical protein
MSVCVRSSIAMLLVACSGSKSAGTTDAGASGGRGGAGDASMTSVNGSSSSTGGASHGGAGGSDAGAAGGAGVSAGIACFRYIEAQCNRLAECRGIEDALCVRAASSCPQIFLSPGSTRTIDNLMACGQAWTTFDCDRALRGEIPACATPGTLEPGAVCTAGSQCASAVCVGGACSTPANRGGACSASVTCPPGDGCVAGSCSPRELPTPETGKGRVGGVGASCVWPANCQGELFCEFVATTPRTGRCALPPSAGSACGDAQLLGNSYPTPLACDDASYCGKDEICHDLPPIGAPCGEARYDGAIYCAKGGHCNSSTMKCEPALKLGESCAESTAFSRTGQPLAEPCDPSTGASCTCAGGGFCGGQPGACLVRRKPGESCTRNVEICIHGSTCIDGRCDYAPTPGQP